MLHQRQDAVGHELGGAHRRPAPRNLRHGHHAATGGHLHPPSGPGGCDLVSANVTTRVDHDLDSVTLHRCYNRGDARLNPSVTGADER